jgi:hypothetical protein
MKRVTQEKSETLVSSLNDDKRAREERYRRLEADFSRQLTVAAESAARMQAELAAARARAEQHQRAHQDDLRAAHEALAQGRAAAEAQAERAALAEQGARRRAADAEARLKGSD